MDLYWYTPLGLITACVLIINRDILILMVICMYMYVYPQGLREYDIDGVILDKTLTLVCTVKFVIHSLDRLSL